ncbi:MAG: hypothetical protein MHMPM18_000965 [Marteilia pararefringens]
MHEAGTVPSQTMNENKGITLKEFARDQGNVSSHGPIHNYINKDAKIPSYNANNYIIHKEEPDNYIYNNANTNVIRPFANNISHKQSNQQHGMKNDLYYDDHRKVVIGHKTNNLEVRNTLNSGIYENYHHLNTGPCIDINNSDGNAELLHQKQLLHGEMKNSMPLRAMKAVKQDYEPQKPMGSGNYGSTVPIVDSQSSKAVNSSQDQGFYTNLAERLREQHKQLKHVDEKDKTCSLSQEKSEADTMNFMKSLSEAVDRLNKSLYDVTPRSSMQDLQTSQSTTNMTSMTELTTDNGEKNNMLTNSDRVYHEKQEGKPEEVKSKLELFNALIENEKRLSNQAIKTSTINPSDIIKMQHMNEETNGRKGQDLLSQKAPSSVIEELKMFRRLKQ